jgi:hypothetical protein
MKTVAQRVSALRKRRQEAGLTRLEVFAHPEDHGAIKLYAAMLQAERNKKGRKP